MEGGEAFCLPIKKDLDISRLIPRSWVLGERNAEGGVLLTRALWLSPAETASIPVYTQGTPLCFFQRLVQDGVPDPVCTAHRCLPQLTLYLPLSPKQSWAPHRDVGVQRSM